MRAGKRLTNREAVVATCKDSTHQEAAEKRCNCRWAKVGESWQGLTGAVGEDSAPKTCMSLRACNGSETMQAEVLMLCASITECDMFVSTNAQR